MNIEGVLHHEQERKRAGKKTYFIDIDGPYAEQWNVFFACGGRW
jgi:hypothetical protein